MQSSQNLRINKFTTTEEASELIKLIGEWKMYVGIKDELTAEQIKFCTAYIRDEFGYFSINNIRDAIKLSLRGYLNIDARPYGVFSPLYIATILTAYESFVKGRQQPKPEPAKIDERTQDEKKLYYLKEYQRMAKEGTPMPDLNDTMWLYLTGNGHIDQRQAEDVFLRSEAQKILERKTEPGKPFDFTPKDVDKLTKQIIMQSFFKENTIWN